MFDINSEVSKVSGSFSCCFVISCACVQYKNVDGLLILLLQSTSFSFIIAINPRLLPFPSSIICPLTCIYSPPAIPPPPWHPHYFRETPGGWWSTWRRVRRRSGRLGWSPLFPEPTRSVTQTLTPKDSAAQSVSKCLIIFFSYNSLIHSFIHSLPITPFFRSSIRPFIDLFLYWFIHPLTRPVTDPLPIYFHILSSAPSHQSQTQQSCRHCEGTVRATNSNGAHISLHQAGSVEGGRLLSLAWWAGLVT